MAPAAERPAASIADATKPDLAHPPPAVSIPGTVLLPKWAKYAFDNLFLAIVALLMERHAGTAGKILIGLSLLVHSGPLLSFATWAFFTFAYLIRFRIDKVRGEPPSSRRDDFATIGGWLGLVPFIMLWVWGPFYLAGDNHHWVNRLALIVWAAWFLLGLIVATVNGVRQWLRLRRE